jgi:hypothetical protein
VPKPQTLTASIDVGELVDTLHWETTRKEIDNAGALHIGDGFGLILLRLNDTAVVALKIREDQRGKVVVDVSNPRNGAPVGRLYPEDDGVVPARIVKPRTS